MLEAGQRMSTKSKQKSLYRKTAENNICVNQCAYITTSFLMINYRLSSQHAMSHNLQFVTPKIPNAEKISQYEEAAKISGPIKAAWITMN